MSIRAGGLLLICYLFFFFFLLQYLKFLKAGKIDRHGALTVLLQIAGITIAAWFLSILLWPYALQNPLKNVIESYRVMAHFPSTFRQIFEGRNEWSDFMPWYYLPKSMLITIPVIAIAGLLSFTILAWEKMPKEKVISYIMIIFTIIFPAVFVIIEKSNLYSSWRQFLFLYPGIVLLAATGLHYLFDIVEKELDEMDSVCLSGNTIHPSCRFHPAEHALFLYVL